MAQNNQSSSSSVAPICVIGSRYIPPNSLDLKITRKLMHMTDGNFEVTDANDNIMFKVSSKLSLHDRRRILDRDDKPIANLKGKIMSIHHKWEAFRGEGSEPSDLIFSAQMSKVLFQVVNTEINVFLANTNKELGVCDFKVKGSWPTCTVYAGESSKIIAQMHAKLSVTSVLFAKDKFMVTIYPNVDSAFIVALVMILDGMFPHHIYN